MIKIIEHQVISEIRLQRPPVNAINMELMEALIAAHKEIVRKGSQVIVLSGKEGMFSAGLDVPELLQMSRSEVVLFWACFFRLQSCLLGSSIPLVAAVTGHAPAGGAVLALQCDYRVAASGDWKIGLNEVQVGLAIPAPVLAVLRFVVGERTAGRLAMTGEMLSMDQALAVGMVDELVEPAQVVGRAIEYAQKLSCLPQQAMNATRLQAKEHLLQYRVTREHIEVATDAWFADETQTVMRGLAERLGK